MLRGDIPALSINSSKEAGLTDLWRFIASELIISLIYYILLIFGD
jgi:hypothetical protein